MKNFNRDHIFERYNDVMYDEREYFTEFLNRIGCDKYKLENPIEVMDSKGYYVEMKGFRKDEGVFIYFLVDTYLEKNVEWQCFDFAYGELSRVLDKLPDEDKVTGERYENELRELRKNWNLSKILYDSPLLDDFGKPVIDDIEIGSNNIVYRGNGGKISFAKDGVIMSNLIDHLRVQILHESKEYMEVMRRMRNLNDFEFEAPNVVMFCLEDTDEEVDLLKVGLDDKRELFLVAMKVSDGEEITLHEKDIRPNYLSYLMEWMKEFGKGIVMLSNGHEEELVRKINDAWSEEKYRDKFGIIIYAIVCRDYDMESEIEHFGRRVEDSNDVLNFAGNILECDCDDQDLRDILSFIRYEED